MSNYTLSADGPSFPYNEWQGLTLTELEAKRQALREESSVYEKKYKALYSHGREVEAIVVHLQETAKVLEKYMYSREPRTLEDVRIALLLINEYLGLISNDTSITQLAINSVGVLEQFNK